MACLFELLLIICGGYPNPFDTNIRVGSKRPPVHVTGSSERNWHLARERKSPRHLVGCREGCPNATYLLQHLEALPERLTRMIELTKDLRAWISDVSLNSKGVLHHPGSLRVPPVRPLEASEGTRRTPHRKGVDRVGPETESMTYLTRRDVVKP